jgi:hypothetical protein
LDTFGSAVAITWKASIRIHLHNQFPAFFSKFVGTSLGMWFDMIRMSGTYISMLILAYILLWCSHVWSLSGWKLRSFQWASWNSGDQPPRLRYTR